MDMQHRSGETDEVAGLVSCSILHHVCSIESMYC